MKEIEGRWEIVGGRVCGDRRGNGNLGGGVLRSIDGDRWGVEIDGGNNYFSRKIFSIVIYYKYFY